VKDSHDRYANIENGALISVTREYLPPAENRFLAAVCLASLGALAGERATPAGAQAEDGPGGEDVKSGQLG